MCALTLALAGAGCGKDGSFLDEEQGDGNARPAATATSSSAAASVEAALPDALKGEEREAAAIVLKYARAIADGNYERVCATRVREERRQFERQAGSCERAFLLIFKGKPRELFATIEAGDVRIEGDLAGVDLVQPGQSEPALTLAAKRVRDRWRMIDVPDAQVP